jgi:hypothetical protein
VIEREAHCDRYGKDSLTEMNVPEQKRKKDRLIESHWVLSYNHVTIACISKLTGATLQLWVACWFPRYNTLWAYLHPFEKSRLSTFENVSH